MRFLSFACSLFLRKLLNAVGAEVDGSSLVSRGHARAVGFVLVLVRAVAQEQGVGMAGRGVAWWCAAWRRAQPGRICRPLRRAAAAVAVAALAARGADDLRVCVCVHVCARAVCVRARDMDSPCCHRMAHSVTRLAL